MARAADDEESEQRWREWELELAEGADRGLLDRLSNRLLDAGAVPAGHGSKLARVLDGEDTDGPDAVEPPADPVHRAVAEQVEQLLVWDRAVRADAYDSVHQMRVITRKIRSLLQASEGAFGITDDAWILDELRQLAAVLGVARDAEVLAERYEQALDELPEELARGPVRERLVEGAKKHYKSGLRRSLTAMRSQRYFRLLDALEGLVAAEPPPTPPGEEPAQLTIDSAYKRVRKAAKAAAQAADAEKRRGAASNPQGRQATSIHRGRDRRQQGFRPRQDDPDAARRPSGQRGQPHASEPPGRGRSRRRRGHLYLRAALSAGGRPGAALPRSSSTTR